MYCNKKLNVDSSNQEIQRVNPVCPNINMLILHTALYTFPVLLIRRSCLTITGLLGGWLFPV